MHHCEAVAWFFGVGVWVGGDSSLMAHQIDFYTCANTYDHLISINIDTFYLQCHYTFSSAGALIGNEKDSIVFTI